MHVEGFADGIVAPCHCIQEAKPGVKTDLFSRRLPQLLQGFGAGSRFSEEGATDTRNLVGPDNQCTRVGFGNPPGFLFGQSFYQHLRLLARQRVLVDVRRCSRECQSKALQQQFTKR